MPELVRVFLVDSHPLILVGIRAVITALPDPELVGEAVARDEIWSACQEKQPDVMLLATNINNFPITEALMQAQQYCPGLRVLVLLSNQEDVCLPQLTKNGAAGGILKSELPENLLLAIRTVVQGQPWFSPLLLKRILQPEIAPLTNDEIALLRLMVVGKTDRAMADAMGLSQRALRRRLKQICEKLGIEARIEAAYLAGLHRLLEENDS